MDVPDWADRFMSKVDKNGPVPQHRPNLGPCWLWTAYITPAGYGRFELGHKMMRAHRMAYELGVGWIPDGLVIDHLCRVRHCVNWNHLEAVTVAVNTRRAHRGSPRGARYQQLKRYRTAVTLRLTEEEYAWLKGRQMPKARIIADLIHEASDAQHARRDYSLVLRALENVPF